MEYIRFWDIPGRLAIIAAALKRPAYRRRYRIFLQRLRTARTEAGLTQAEVARKLGRPQSFVSKCESGERRLDAVELAEFGHLYGKALTFFVGWGAYQIEDR